MIMLRSLISFVPIYFFNSVLLNLGITFKLSHILSINYPYFYVCKSKRPCDFIKKMKENVNLIFV